MRNNYYFLLYFYFINNILCNTEGIFFPKREGITILTDYTFEEAISEYQYILISIYSDICRVCLVHINPMLSNLTKEIENDEPELKDIVSIAKLDGSSNQKFMNKYNIIGYPSILLLKNGVIIGELVHKKNVEDLLLSLRKHILRPIQYIKSKEQFNRLIKNPSKETFITYYGSNKEEINSLKDISYLYNYLTFINIQDLKLIEELNATEGQISINKYFDEPKIIESPKINELWTKDNINNFIKKYNHRLLIDFTTYEGENLINQRKNILLLINKIELTKDQIKRVEYMDKVNVKENIMNEENKKNKANFLEISKNVRDIIQSSFIIYKTNLEIVNEEKNYKKKEKTLLDKDDPFGFEKMKQEKKECERRQINFIKKLNLNNETNCEIRLIDFECSKSPKFYNLKCGKEFIDKNIIIIKKWYNKDTLDDLVGIDFDL